jgi:DNA repair protein RadC
MHMEALADCVGNVCTSNFSPVRDLPRITLSLRIERQATQLYVMSDSVAASRALDFLRESSEEKFIAIHLNARYEVIGIHEVSHGTLSASLVHPREVLKAAMLSNAHALMFAHNHPSGSELKESDEDTETTKKLIAAGKLMGINVVDHLIVSPYPGEFYSFREEKPELWSEYSWS